MSKDLKDKAIKIQGKDYVLVSDRILYFNQEYTDGWITTELLSPPESDIVIVKALIFTGEGSRCFTGHSQAVKGAGFINKTAALENAETSAVGRALAMMGIGVIDSVASIDEIKKAEGTDAKLAQLKAKLYAEFGKAGIKEFADQKAFVKKTLNKDTVDSVEEADKVLAKLNEG